MWEPTVLGRLTPMATPPFPARPGTGSKPGAAARSSPLTMVRHSESGTPRQTQSGADSAVVLEGDRVRDLRGARRPVDGGVPMTDHLDTGLLDWLWDGRLEEQGYTPCDLNTTAKVLSRVCPTCGASIGAWCRTAATGNLLAHIDLQHVARRIFTSVTPARPSV